MNNTKESLISIIIPTYNRAWCITEAIESALAQTYPNREVIVIDDGSTDNTATVIQQYNNQISFIQKENGGVSSARNTGFKHSKGDFLIFLDSDDLLSPDLLQSHIQAAHLYPDADIFGAGCAFKQEDGTLLVHTSEWPKLPDRPLELVFLKPPPPPACQMYRRRVLELLGGYDETLWCSEDSDLFIRAVVTGSRIVRTVGGYAQYRPSPDSITVVNSQIRLHKTAVTLRNKHQHLFARTNPQLKPLINARLDFWRRVFWESVLTFHWSLKPLSLLKLGYYLAGTSLADPGYFGYLIRARPWKK